MAFADAPRAIRASSTVGLGSRQEGGTWPLGERYRPCGEKGLELRRARRGRNKVRGCGELWPGARRTAPYCVVVMRFGFLQTCLRNTRFNYFYFYAFGALPHSTINAVNNCCEFGVGPPIHGTVRGVRFSLSRQPRCLTRQLPTRTSTARTQTNRISLNF